MPLPPWVREAREWIVAAITSLCASLAFLGAASVKDWVPFRDRLIAAGIVCLLLSLIFAALAVLESPLLAWVIEGRRKRTIGGKYPVSLFTMILMGAAIGALLGGTVGWGLWYRRAKREGPPRVASVIDATQRVATSELPATTPTKPPAAATDGVSTAVPDKPPSAAPSSKGDELLSMQAELREVLSLLRRLELAPLVVPPPSAGGTDTDTPSLLPFSMVLRTEGSESEGRRFLDMRNNLTNRVITVRMPIKEVTDPHGDRQYPIDGDSRDAFQDGRAFLRWEHTTEAVAVIAPGATRSIRLASQRFVEEDDHVIWTMPFVYEDGSVSEIMLDQSVAHGPHYLLTFSVERDSEPGLILVAAFTGREIMGFPVPSPR